MVRDKLALVTLAHQLAVAYSLGALLYNQAQLLFRYVHRDNY